MKAGSFNIHDYLGSLYENVNEELYNNKLNEEKAETENGSSEEGLIIPEENKNSYEWLKGEFKKGKTEVKVEMSSHTFKPGYELEDAPKSTKSFPGMYGQSKQGEAGTSKTTSTFKQNNFKTSNASDNKNNNDSSKSEEKEEGKKQSKPKVEVKTKEKEKEDNKKEDKDKGD